MHSSGEVLMISSHLQHFPADAAQIIKHNATFVQNLNAAGAELTSSLMPHSSLESALHIVRAKKLEVGTWASHTVFNPFNQRTAFPSQFASNEKVNFQTPVRESVVPGKVQSKSQFLVFQETQCQFLL